MNTINRRCRALACAGGIVAALWGDARPLAATPPETPYERLERRAAEEGVSAVRADYQALIEASLNRLDSSSAREPEAAFRRSLERVWLYEIVFSWARLQAREVWRGRSDRATAGMLAAELAECLGRADRGWAADQAGARVHFHAQRAGARAEPTPAEPSFDHDRRLAIRQVAMLAKLDQDAGVLDRLFELEEEIDGCRAATEFLTQPHDWSALAGVAPPGTPVAPAFSPETESAVRRVVAEYFGALGRGDGETLAGCFADPATGRATAAKLAGSPLGSFDLGSAQVTLEPGGAGRFRVVVTGIRRGGSAGAGAKRFDMTIENGEARILAVGGVR